MPYNRIPEKCKISKHIFITPFTKAYQQSYPNPSSIVSSFFDSIPYPLVRTDSHFSLTVVIGTVQAKMIGHCFVEFGYIYKQAESMRGIKIALQSQSSILHTWKHCIKAWTLHRKTRSNAGVSNAESGFVIKHFKSGRTVTQTFMPKVEHRWYRFMEMLKCFNKYVWENFQTRISFL